MLSKVPKDFRIIGLTCRTSESRPGCITLHDVGDILKIDIIKSNYVLVADLHCVLGVRYMWPIIQCNTYRGTCCEGNTASITD